MPIMNELYGMYKKRGHHIVNGIHSKQSGLPHSEFTHIVADDNTTTLGLGISPSEIYFLEHLFEDYSPQSIFIVGNSFGWSTLALSLLNPEAKVVAIEAGMNSFTDAWIEKSNEIAKEEGLNAVVEKGISPQDVAGVVERNFPEPVDFVFIDGDHTNKQAALDFEAIRAFSRRETIFLFNDVLYRDLGKGIRGIVERTGLDGHVLWRTSSGMCVLCHDDCHEDKLELLSNFSLGPKTASLFASLKKVNQESARNQALEQAGLGGAL